MNKQFFGVIIVVLVALFAVFSFSKGNDDKGNGGGSSNAQPSSHVEGKKDSKVTLIEYGDFQCPACKSYYPIVKELKASYGDKIQFQFRHFPLVQIHPNAFVASRAAEAAGKQGKFFDMHDLLYENQDSWKQSKDMNPIMEGYASQLSLDMEKFKADMASPDAAAIINADIKAGQAIKANSTPTFAINNKKIEQNPRSLDEFKKLLDDELAKNP